MFRKIIIPFLAILGLLFSVFMIYYSARKPKEQQILFQPAESPYKNFVFGEGIVESFNENIELSVAFPELITDVYIKPGQKVKKGQPLFKLDTRELEAKLKTAYKELEKAKTNFKDLEKQFSYFEKLKNKSAVSKREYTRTYFSKKLAEDQVKINQAKVNELKVQIHRSTTYAPFDGQIIQENIRIGEFANVNPFDREPLIIFGRTDKLQIRINIAEEDAWRVYENAPAVVFIRGNSNISFELKFKYIEPYVVPKQSLTGSDFERIDTRVLQVVYELERDNKPIYVGQLLDAFVEALPNNINNKSKNKDNVK